MVPWTKYAVVPCWTRWFGIRFLYKCQFDDVRCMVSDLLLNDKQKKSRVIWPPKDGDWNSWSQKLTRIIRGGYDEWTTSDIDYVHYYQAGPNATMHWCSMERFHNTPGPWSCQKRDVPENHPKSPPSKKREDDDKAVDVGCPIFRLSVFSFTFSCDVYWANWANWAILMLWGTQFEGVS